MKERVIKLTDLQQFDNLELIAKQVVEGFIIGLHKSPFHGFSVEFAEHQLYNPGDSTKNIDWKVFARTDRMYTKRFEEETNLRCQIIIDASSSMYFPDEKLEKKVANKMRFSVMSAAAMIHLLKRQRDAVGLSVFSYQLEVHTKSKSSLVHNNLLYVHLEKLLEKPQENKRTAATRSLHQIAESIHKRSLVVIFSDMLEGDENQDKLFDALQHLRYNKHEVILFHVVDKKRELDFEFENRPYVFVDMETGEKVKLQANQIKAHYVDEMAKMRQQLKLKCGQFQIDFVEADIHEGFDQVLRPYLVKRTKMF
jgi:uncharacterized protein (DUF58 family)